MLHNNDAAKKKSIRWERREVLKSPGLCPGSITDSAVEPLKVELAELEQLVRDQQDKICAVKASILRNEEKIQKLVCGISLSSSR